MYAIDIIENTRYKPLSLYKKYTSLLHFARKNKVSLIGFHIAKYVINEPSNFFKKKEESEDFFKIKSVVIDKKTLKPIPYVNVGIFKENIGTVSNIKGFFSLQIPKKQGDKLLTFSCIGYKTVQLSIKKLYENNVHKIFLLEESIPLDEVVVRFKSSHKKNKILGTKKVVEKKSGYILGKGAGAEIAKFIKNKKKGIIKSVSIFIGRNSASNFKLRVNIYSSDKNTSLPLKNLMKKPEIISSSIKKGWITLHLKNPIIIEKSFFIAFEWLDDKVKNPSIGFEKGIFSKNNAYQRTISQGKWLKSIDFNWAIKCEVSY